MAFKATDFGLKISTTGDKNMLSARPGHVLAGGTGGHEQPHPRLPRHVHPAGQVPCRHSHVRVSRASASGFSRLGRPLDQPRPTRVRFQGLTLTRAPHLAPS